MEVLEAIRRRRAVRDYLPNSVPVATLRQLITAASWAPSAMNQQPWHFTVVTERAMLDDISVRSKAWLLKTASDMSSSDHFRDMLRDPHFHLFYGAPALVVISTPVSAQWSVEDCSLAAQNLMLAAVDLDLGSCWIGFAQGWLNTPEGRECLGLSASSCVVAPITIGYPRSEAPLVSRKAPIVTWIGVLPSAESGPPGSSNSPPSHP
jgi:nitroreductase